MHRQALTVMEQNARLAPFVRPKLPHLARREDTYDPVPRIRAKLIQGFNRIDDVIPLRARPCLAAWLYRGALAIYGYEVFCFCRTLGGQTRACFSRWLETIVVRSAGSRQYAGKGTYIDSWRKRRTLYIVMRDVGDDDIMIIGYIFSACGVSGIE